MIFLVTCFCHTCDHPHIGVLRFLIGLCNYCLLGINFKSAVTMHEADSIWW